MTWDDQTLSLLNNTGSLTTPVSWNRGVIEVEMALSMLKTWYTWIDGSDLRFHKQIHAKTTLGLFSKYNPPLLKTGLLFVTSSDLPRALLCKLRSWFLAPGSEDRQHADWITLHSWSYETVMPKAGGVSWNCQPLVQQKKCSNTLRTEEMPW